MGDAPSWFLIFLCGFLVKRTVLRENEPLRKI